ncbi:MAG: riboflavin synthase [Bacteroidota bacterium]
MFTGIVETTGTIEGIEIIGTNHSFWIKSDLSDFLKADQSVSHNGVCLTVEAINEGHHKVTAVLETLQKTNLGGWLNGSMINMERCLPVNGRLDGHLVQGHVDATAICTSLESMNGSWYFTFEFPSAFAHLVIEKGSICLNGISLTGFNVTDNSVTVAIIPYTYEHTNIQTVKPGDTVNIEFDILGKYLSRWHQLDQKVAR